MKCNSNRNIFLSVLLILALHIGAQNKIIIEVDNDGLAASFGVRGVYDKGNALWYTNPKGLIKYINNQTFFFPYAKKDNKDVVASEASPLFFTSTNEIFQILDQKDNGIYRFNIDTEKGEWLASLEKNDWSMHEDNNSNLWFVARSGDVYKFNLLDNSFEKLVITQIKNKNTQDIDAKRNFSEALLRVTIVDDKVLFQKRNNVYYFEDKISKKLIIDGEFYDYETSTVSPPLVAKLGDFYPLPSSTTYTFNNKVYNVIYNEEFNCHIFQLPRFYLNNESDMPQVLNILKSIPSENSLNKVNKHRYIYSTGRVLGFFGLKHVNGKNELFMSEFKTFGDNIVDVAIEEEEIAVFTWSTIEITSTTGSFFDKLLNSKRSTISVRPMVEGDDGTIFIQTNLGFYKLKNDEIEHLNIGYEDVGRDFFYAYDMIIKDEFLWILALDKLYKFDTNTNRYVTYKLLNLLNFGEDYSKVAFKYIEELDEDKLLLTANVGLYEFNTASKTLKSLNTFSENIEINNVSHIVKGNSTTAWFISNLGVFQIDKNYKILKKLKLNKHFKPRLLFKTRENELKIVMDTNLVLNYNLTNDEIDQDSYFRDNNYTIASLFRDGNDIWVSTYTGLIYYDENRPEEKRIITVNEGLSSNEFNTNSFLKTSTNEFFLGGIKGLIKFKTPLNLNEKEDSLKIKLEKASLLTNNGAKEVYSKKMINETGEIDLSVAANSLDLFCSSNLGNLKSENLVYLYRNLSISEKWFNLDNSGLIRLYNLPIDKNKIQVKAKYNTIESNILDFNVKVNDVFYKEFWFILLLVILTLSGIVIIIMNKIQERSYRQKTAFSIQKLELQSLISQMNPHFLFNTINNLQTILLSSEPEKVNEYFESFGLILRQTLKMSKLRSIELSEEINYLDSYLLISKMRLNDELIYNIEAPSNLVSKNIKIPALIIQPIVENSIIHGLKPKQGEKKLSIVFKIYDDTLFVEITDNGIGRKEAKKIKENSFIKPNSLSSNILNKRMFLINTKGECSISLTYEDLTPEIHATHGTKVIIEFIGLIKNKYIT